MRAKTLTTAVLIVGLTSACTAGVKPVAGGPPTAPPAASSSANTAPSAAPSEPATPTHIGPFGFGALRLGMTFKQANATGLLTNVKHEGDAWEASLRGSSKAKVLISQQSGVEVIDAYGTVSTPEGIHIGSTRAAVKAAYPTWKNITGPEVDGRGYGPAAGNAAAWYRIVTAKGTVVQLTLQLRNQHFYE